MKTRIFEFESRRSRSLHFRNRSLSPSSLFGMRQVILKTTSSHFICRSLLPFIPALFAFIFIFSLRTGAVEVGTPVSQTTLTNINGEAIAIGVSPGKVGELLYFAAPSSAQSEGLSGFEKIASGVSGLEICYVCPRQAQPPQARAEDMPSNLAILLDDKNLASTFGSHKNLPSVVILGSGNTLLAAVDDVKNPSEAVQVSADIFIANGYPSVAKAIYTAAPESWLKEQERPLLLGYAGLLNGEIEYARATLREPAEASSTLSAELHAAMGFLLLQEGDLSRALAECRQAQKNAFARWVSGMAHARAGDCDRAQAAFAAAAQGRFLFRWQQAAAFNSAAVVAQSKEEQLPLYKKSFELAPLNQDYTANLMTFYWRQGKRPNAAAYADLLRTAGNLDPLIRSLLAEFDNESLFLRSPSARRQLEKRIKAGVRPKSVPPQRKILLIPDFGTFGCPSELTWLDCASAAYLKACLERDPTITALRRSEALEAEKILKIPKPERNDNGRLKQVAQALSADYLVLGKVGTYEKAYLMNVRIADVNTGEIPAVASERFVRVEGTTAAIEKTAAELLKQLNQK